MERTDETHSITMPEIIEALVAYDISTERKSLYISLILKLFGTMDSQLLQGIGCL